MSDGSLSDNELIALMRKAAQGAGAPEDLAETAARSGRWLHGVNCNGALALLHCLHATGDPEVDFQLRSANAASLISLVTQFDGLVDEGASFEVGGRDVGLAIGVAGFLAQERNCAFQLTGSEGQRGCLLRRGTVDADECGASLPAQLVSSPCIEIELQAATCAASTDTPEPAWPRPLRVVLDDHLRAALTQLAARTMVPASDQSRLAGAGAGLTDND